MLCSFKKDSFIFCTESIEVSFYPIQCKIVGGKIVNNEHEEVKFISIDDINNFDFAPPDYKTVDLVKENFAEMNTQAIEENNKFRTEMANLLRAKVNQ